MKTKVIYGVFLLIFICSSFVSVKAQTKIFEECWSNDFGGILSAGNPDILPLGALTGSEVVLYIGGCTQPSDADYDDFFRIYVPVGYSFSALQFGYIGEAFFENTTEMRLDLWYGNSATPVGSPDISGGTFGPNTDSTLLANILQGVGPLAGGNWYSIRVDMVNWPSSMRYLLYFTFTCNDITPPVFTTPAGSLNATIACSNGAAIAAALAAQPAGTDNNGNPTLVMTSDQTVPAPGCPNAYTRTRIWRLEDDCGNLSPTFTQTITVTDNTPPTVISVVGSLDATISCDNPVALVAALAQVPTGSDACGSATPVLQLDTTIPDPDCPNGYVRSRTWRFVDACGNQSLAVFIQTITVYDNTAPVFTTAPNALNATLECSDLAGIAAALVLQPSGTDNCGSVELVLFWDVITPDPDCPNAYTHSRAWRLLDQCGNQSAVNYSQIITVQDNTPPAVSALDGPVAIYDINGYFFQKEDLLDLAVSHDNCSDELIVVSIVPSMVTCDQLGMFIPVEIIVADECGNQSVVVAIKEVTEDLSIKPPFHQSDIGAAISGDALHYVCDEEYHVSSAGFTNLHQDVAHFVYVEMCGDGEITARLNAVHPSGAWGGVMIREDLSAGSRKMSLESAMSNAVRRDIRSTVNGNSMLTQWPAMPGMIWMRINRTGNTFNLFTSYDGINWQFRGASPLVLQECVLMGIYAESINNNIEATAIFDEVVVSGGVSARPGTTTLEEVAVNVAKSEADHQAIAFPNPATSDLYINLNEMAELAVCVEILDLSGRTIQYHSFGEGFDQLHIDISQLTEGMYLCKLQSKCGHSRVLKFIKQ